MTVQILNHASALLRVGRVGILTDPWFEGTAFSGGWGLRQLNPDAYRAAAEATHLWISHWHSDHLHAPTLARLAAHNPSIRVLANVSANFTMVDRLAGLGFRDVVALAEREPLRLDDGISVTRYPTAGIDNMLHIAGQGFSVLDYNDCNLPVSGARALGRKIGAIDLLMCSYNHAGKLFELSAVEALKRSWFAKLPLLADVFETRWAIPFASGHYYRSAYTRDQNASHLSFEDLAARTAADPRFCILRPGDSARFESPTSTPAPSRRDPPLPAQPEETHDYDSPMPLDELLHACTTRARELRRNFPGGSVLVAPLRVDVTDLRCTIELDLRTDARVTEASPHIATHSRALFDWLARRFGDDTFFAGAHFAILDVDTSVIQRWALLTLLEASHLDPRSMVSYLGSARGLNFLWCRREEIVASVTARRLKAAQRRI